MQIILKFNTNPAVTLIVLPLKVAHKPKPAKEDACPARKEEIFVLPGVELSVNDGANGIHTLVVFSDEWLESGQDYINQFLNAAFEGKYRE